MAYRWKLLKMLVLIILVALALYYVPAHTGLIKKYDRHIFNPFQSFRGKIFCALPFSIGDIIYILGGIWLLMTLIKWIRFIIRFGQYKERLGLSVLSTINTILFVYLFFFIGWGANYYKMPLTEYWGLRERDRTDTAWMHDPVLRKQVRTQDSLALIAYDSFLVNKLNIYAPHYHPMPLKEISERAKDYFSAYTDCKVKGNGLGIKPSLFGYFMIRLGIEGYYNPFTGEGQVDKTLPAFLMPFLISHETAHQAGIAAEDDANLLAYALCTSTDDSTFRYSSYLDIWQYTHYRLWRRDSVSAKRFEGELNKLTRAHIDTIEQISEMYQNQFAHYSGKLYDSYLKMQDQKKGIRSYSNVSSSAWKLEQQRIAGKQEIISIP